MLLQALMNKLTRKKKPYSGEPKSREEKKVLKIELFFSFYRSMLQELVTEIC